MARKSKISRENAISAAINAFWKFGYGSIGVRQLEEETGINRFMLQTVFGGKEGLFIEALKGYSDFIEKMLFLPLKEGDLSSIEAFFELRVNRNMFTKPEYGCLAINTLSEDSDLSPAVKAGVNRHFALMREAFEGALKNEKSRGTLRDEVDTVKAGEFLMNSAVGLNVVMRNDGTNTNALQTVEMIKNILDGWRHN